MPQMKGLFFTGISFIVFYCLITFNMGCAQISAPTGGDRDTIAPVLIRANPTNETTNFQGNRIALNFDEYIEVEDVSKNVMVSPLQKSNPIITWNFKTVNIRFRDTLLPNTTYSINFGNAIKDLNEGNPLPDLVYTFSTGNTIDSMSFGGNVLLAETGQVDSTLQVLLYRNLADSAVSKLRPAYAARVKGDGSFIFNNLPPDNFRVYALKDGDGGKTYNSKTETFAFIDSSIRITEKTTPITLYAYNEVKPTTGPAAPVLRASAEKRLRITNNLQAAQQDLLAPLILTFNNPVKRFETAEILLVDTNYQPVRNTTLSFDSTRKILKINTTWQPATRYNLLLPKNAIEDSSGNLLTRTDTINFTTKKVEDYGSVLIRFSNLDVARKPVLQFVQTEEVKLSFPISTNQWSDKMFPPGEYTIRILYDENGNGKWDPGNFTLKRQPEKAITLPQKLSVRANWDNEQDINLK